MSDTPRTDAAIALIDENGELVRAEFARQLERRLLKVSDYLYKQLDEARRDSGDWDRGCSPATEEAIQGAIAIIETE
jgi:hypothetical protein